MAIICLFLTALLSSVNSCSQPNGWRSKTLPELVEEGKVEYPLWQNEIRRTYIYIYICIYLLWYFLTARVCSTLGRYCFHRCVSVNRAGGIPVSSPRSLLGEGSTSVKIRTRGIPLSPDRNRTGVLPPLSPSPPSTRHALVRYPAAVCLFFVTEEDFLATCSKWWFYLQRNWLFMENLLR